MSKRSKACDISNTMLIMFPAHNENSASISAAQKANPSVRILNWRSELVNLIAEHGVDRWALCINDTYEHSTPLAGYVGAHMIYRAIYGETPKKGLTQSISQYYVDSILGSYSSEGYYSASPLLYLD